jgi:WhiB family redox-sensing transcriptional regulator
MNQHTKTVEEEAWIDSAACLGVDPELFFPRKGENNQLAEAKSICARCVVRDDCLEYALVHREKFGVWGGTSERERRRLRVPLRAVAS